MSRMRWQVVAVGLLTLVVGAGYGFLAPNVLAGQGTAERKARVKPSPVFPEVARKLKITGTVKIEVTIAPNGNVISTKAVGGHPLLVESAMDAVRKWRFDPAAQTTTDVITFEFKPDLSN